ncbi:hypothetical protein M5689_001285 [Euphorbia peplus]|nr:hypothetical protein M5689_001285 [Euphorbia peplus]
MFLSTPEMGGPLTRTHKQGCPKDLTAVQQASLGGIGLKGATAALHGIICTNAEKNVLPHDVGDGDDIACPFPFSTTIPNITTITTTIIFTLFIIFNL